MTVQTVPYVLQNASHSAALFRQSASAPFTGGGALSQAELGVTQQGTPNMSVLLGPGRAKVTGTSVSPPAGQSWTTQAMYDVLNDAALTLTIAAANPTNPRIDLVYIQVRDAFYSGANNDAIAGVVTGTPAASPVAPATPANAVAIATVAVGAGVTTIVNANISRIIGRASLLGSGYVADLDALAALTNMGTGDVREVVELAAMFMYTGSAWVQISDAYFASAAARDTAYAKASGAYRIAGRARVFRTDTGYPQTYNGTIWRYTMPGMIPVIPTSAVNGTVGSGGVVTFSGVTSVSLNGCFTGEFDNYMIVTTATIPSSADGLAMRFRQAGVDIVSSSYLTAGQQIASASPTVTYATSTQGSIGRISTTACISNVTVGSPFLSVPTQWTFLSMDGAASGQGGVNQTTAGSIDGITLKGVGGAVSMTGTIRVYGYNNN